HVTRTATTPRYEHFARSLAEASTSATHSDSDAKPSASHERHQSRRINRCDRNRTRYPAPTTLNKGPTSVVEGSEAPRFFFNPSPTPRRDKDPVSVAIRSPVSRHTGRAPYVYVPNNFVPPS